MKKLKMMIVLVIMVSATQAQKQHVLTVREAVELAYKNVVDIKNAELDYRIQEAKNREIYGQALPQVNGTVAANHYLRLPFILFPDATTTAIYQILKTEGVSGSNGPIVDVPAPGLRQVAFQQPWNMNIGATLSQLLFQPDVFVGLQARKTSLDYSRAMVEQVKERVKDSAYKRYYAILIAQKQLYYVGESIKRLEKLYQDDSIMYKNGFAERLDLDKVQVQLNNIRTTYSTIENALNISYAALKFALGLPQQDEVILKEALTADQLKEGLLESSFSYDDRPEIKTLNEVKKLQELDLKRNRLGFIPTVAAVGNYTVTGMGPRFFTSPETVWINSSFVGINISVPIFDGQQRKYKIQQSLLNVEKMSNTIDKVKQAIDLEQVATRGTLINALTNLDAQERNMQLAEKVFNGTKLKFQQGMGSSFEVLQADADMQQAQANYFNALYNATVAKISYQYALGKLP